MARSPLSTDEAPSSAFNRQNLLHKNKLIAIQYEDINHINFMNT